MIGALRRIRAYAGHFAALAALVAIACALLTAAPRVGARITADGLHTQLSAGAPGTRDVIFDLHPTGGPGAAKAGESTLAELHESLPPAVRAAVGSQWYTAGVNPAFARASGAGLHPEQRAVTVGMRTMSGAQKSVRMVSGRWPATTADTDAVIEVAVAVRAARTLGLATGGHFVMSPLDPFAERVQVRITGIYTPIDEKSELWQFQPPMLDATPPVKPESPYTLYAFTDAGGMASLEARRWPVENSWTYRIDPARVSAESVGPLLAGLSTLENTDVAPRNVRTPVHRSLQTFADELAAIAPPSAAVLSGVVAAVAGLIGIVTALMVARRRAEIRLLRGRGAGIAVVARRMLAESLLVVGPAAGLGWAGGRAVPGDPAEVSGPLAGAVALTAVLVVPAAAAWHARTAISAPAARPSAALRITPRRAIAELVLLVLTVMGGVLVRREGLGEGVDVYLVAVPVLLAVSAALVGLRAFPWLLHPVTRIAGRLRGAALFLGLARTARTRIVLLAPVVVVVGVTTATFSAALAGGLSDARDRATDRDVPADVLVTSYGGLRPDTVARLRTAPGVRAAAAFALVPRQDVRGDDSGVGSVLTTDVVVTEDAGLAKVRALSGRGDPLPPGLSARIGGRVGALVSPDLAKQLPGHGQAAVGDRWISFRIAGTITTFPTASADARNLIVLPAAALKAGGTLDGTGIAPTGVALAGPTPDLRGLGTPAPAIESWTGHRDGLEAYGVHPALTFALDCGMAAGLLAALLALVLLVLGGAEDRARLFARLRPLGFPAGRWWVVPGCELGLPVLVTVLAGAAAGLLVPYVLGPAFGLAGITGGVPVAVRVSGGLAGLLAGFGALAVLTVVLAGARARSRTSIEAEAI